MQTPPIIFDRDRVRRNRSHTVKAELTCSDVRDHDNSQLLDRLFDVKRSFETALVCGSDTESTALHVQENHGLKVVIRGEFCEPEQLSASKHVCSGGVIYDDEWVPFRDKTFDLIINVRSLHWVNDLPGALVQLRRCLKSDGLLLTSLLGGRTLYELREVLSEAEMRLRDGVSPRISPFVDVRDAGDLLARAGFALPVADTDTIVLEYASLSELFATLRNMGETNAVIERARGLSTFQLFSLAEDIYRERYQTPTGQLAATFEIITLTGGAPSENQQKPLSPGSAQRRLSEALGTKESSL